jgi:hypothetical protein
LSAAISRLPAGVRVLVRATLVAVAVSGCNLPWSSSGGIALPSGEEAKPVDQIIADAQKDMATFKTIRVVVNTNQKNVGAITFDVSADDGGNVTGGGAAGDAKFDVLVTDGKTYIKGSAFWTKVFSSGSATDPAVQQIVQARIDDHWVTGLDFFSDPATKNNLSPAILADCLGRHGTLSKGATSDINGKKAIEIKDRGDLPGGRAASRFIAVDSPHVVLRFTASGPTTPGATADSGKCKGSATPAAAATSPSPAEPPASVDYNDYGKAVTVTKPTDAIAVSDLFPSE